MPHLKLELFKYTAQGSTQKYHKVWEPFLSDFEIWNFLPSNNPLFSFLFNIYFLIFVFVFWFYFILCYLTILKFKFVIMCIQVRLFYFEVLSATVSVQFM